MTGYSGWQPEALPPAQVDPNVRVAALESTVGQLQARLASFESPPAGFQGSAPCDGGIADACQGCGGPNFGFVAGATLLFAKPHFKESFQVSRVDNANGLMTLEPFNYDYDLSPRIWFGLENRQGTGVRFSYWTFDEQSPQRVLTADGTQIWGAHVVNTMFPANIFAGIPGSQMTVNDYLETNTFNLLGTFGMNLGGTQVKGGAGLRYAKLEQGFDALVTTPIPNFFNRLTWTREFEGVGPTLAFDFRKPLGRTRLAAVATGGGALLFGSKTLDRTVINDQTPVPGVAPRLQLPDADEVVGIGELGTGLEWRADFADGRYLSLRGLYEGQLWAEAGAPTLGFLGFEGFGFQLEIGR